MFVLKISKNDFPSGVNKSRLEGDILAAKIGIDVESITESVTHVSFNTSTATSVDDNTEIKKVVADHDGTPGADSSLDNMAAITDPTINDDINAGYSRGSRWINTVTNKGFLCLDNSSGVSVWKETTQEISTISAIYLNEPFHTSNTSQATMGKLGWKTRSNGTGNSLTSQQAAGHPGIFRLAGGTSTNARRAIILGDGSVSSWLLSTTGISNTIEVEWIIRFGGTIAAADLEILQLGLSTEADADSNGVALDAIAVVFDPSSVNTFRLMAANSGSYTFSNGTTVIAIDTWYRVSIIYTDTGSGGSLQLKVNGNNEGASITTDFPTVSLLEMAKIDSAAGSLNPNVDVDRMRIFYTPNLED